MVEFKEILKSSLTAEEFNKLIDSEDVKVILEEPEQRVEVLANDIVLGTLRDKKSYANISYMTIPRKYLKPKESKELLDQLKERNKEFSYVSIGCYESKTLGNARFEGDGFIYILKLSNDVHTPLSYVLRENRQVPYVTVNKALDISRALLSYAEENSKLKNRFDRGNDLD